MRQEQKDHRPPLRAQHGASAQVHHLRGLNFPPAAARRRYAQRLKPFYDFVIISFFFFFFILKIYFPVC